MLEAMTVSQLQDWMAYYQIEPFGQRRDDLRMATVGAAICNHLRPKKAGPMKVEALMPQFRTKRSTKERVYRKALAFSKMFPQYIRPVPNGDN